MDSDENGKREDGQHKLGEALKTRLSGLASVLQGASKLGARRWMSRVSHSADKGWAHLWVPALFFCLHAAVSVLWERKVHSWHLFHSALPRCFDEEVKGGGSKGAVERL